jgi:hypothetical protein
MLRGVTLPIYLQDIFRPVMLVRTQQEACASVNTPDRPIYKRARKKGRLRTQIKIQKNNTFSETKISNVLRDLPFSQNQLRKSAGG